MKHLVIHKNFDIIEDGQKFKIASSRIDLKCSKINTKEILISSVEFSINRETFKQAVGGTLASSYTFYYYTSTNPDVATWRYNNNDISLSDFGIKFNSNGNILDNNYSIVVVCDTTSQTVKEAYCSGQVVVYKEADTEHFDFVNISCDNLNIALKASGFYSTAHNLSSDIIAFAKGNASNIVMYQGNPLYSSRKYNRLTVSCLYKIYDNTSFKNAKVKIIAAEIEDCEIS